VLKIGQIYMRPCGLSVCFDLNPLSVTANMLQLCTIYACANGTLGLNLSRAPWDPYPWVSGVQAKSSAERGGVRLGDTLLELNGADVLGLKISELANRLQDHWQSGAEVVTLMMWRQQASIDPNEDPAEASHAVVSSRHLCSILLA